MCCERLDSIKPASVFFPLISIEHSQEFLRNDAQACKNCSCGLAEQQAALAREQAAQGRELGAPDSHTDTPTHTPLNTDNSKSACGR